MTGKDNNQSKDAENYKRWTNTDVQNEKQPKADDNVTNSNADPHHGNSDQQTQR